MSDFDPGQPVVPYAPPPGTPGVAPDVSAAPDVSSLPANSRPAQAAPSQTAQPPAPPPQTKMEAITRAVLGVLSGTPTRRLDPITNTIVPAQVTTGEKIGNVLNAGLRGAVAGIGQTGPDRYAKAVAAGAQAQTAANQLQNKDLMDRAAIALHNNEQLMQQRNAWRLDADSQARIVESNRTFDAKAAEQHWTTPPILVDGKDINGQPGHDAEMLKFYSDPKNHRAPEGYTYLYSPVPQTDGTTAHKVYQVPVGDDLDKQVTYSRQEWKDIAGYDYPGKGDEIRSTARDMIGFRAANAKKQTAPSPDSIKTNQGLIDGLPHLSAPQRTAIKQLMSQVETPDHLDRVLEKALSLETSAANIANKPEKPEKPADMVIGTVNGKQVAVPFNEAGSYRWDAGASPTKAGAMEGEKINNARSLINVFDSNDADDLGLTQLAAKLDKQGKLGPAATRFGEWLNKGNTVSNFDAGDSDVQRLFTKIGLSTTGLMQVHVGSRGSAQMLEHFEDLAKAKEMSPSAFRAALDTETRYVRMKAMLPGGGGSGMAVSLAAAKALPQNKGKSVDEIRKDIEAHGHKVVD